VVFEGRTIAIKREVARKKGEKVKRGGKEIEKRKTAKPIFSKSTRSIGFRNVYTARQGGAGRGKEGREEEGRRSICCEQTVRS